MSRKTLEDSPTFRLTRLNRGKTRDGLNTLPEKFAPVRQGTVRRSLANVTLIPDAVHEA